MLSDSPIVLKPAAVAVAMFLALLCFVPPDRAQAQTVIDTVQELEDIGDNLSGNYVLGANINAAGFDFTPIGSASNPFGGTLNGAYNGTVYTISNLNIDSSGSDVGLFAASGGTIENLGLTNEVISSTASSPTIGGIAGINTGTVTQTYVTSGTLTANSASSATAGGLVGDNGGTISLSHASNSVQVSAGTAGGLAGVNAGTVSQSYATGSVSAGNSSTVGGLIGASGGFGPYGNYNPYGSLAPVSQSYATGSVTGGSQSNVGGLIGNSGSQVEGSYATGNVSGGSSSDVGGLLGVQDQYGSLSKSFATGSVTGSASQNVGGLVGWNADTRISQTYALGAVNGNGSANVGGLVGENGGIFPGASIDQSYSAGPVSNVGGGQTGGLVGLNYPLIYNGPNSEGPGSVTNSYWDATASGQPTSGGGVPLTTSQLQSGALPSGFDPTAWRGTTGQYPQLQFQNQLAITSLPSFPTISTQVPSVSALPTSLVDFKSFLNMSVSTPPSLSGFSSTDQSYFKSALSQIGGLLSSTAKTVAADTAPLLTNLSLSTSFLSAGYSLTSPLNALNAASFGNAMVGIELSENNINDPIFNLGSLIASSGTLFIQDVAIGSASPELDLAAFDIGIWGLDFGLAAPYFKEWGNDPADPNFKSVFVPDSIFASDLIDPANPTLTGIYNKLTNDLLSVSEYLNAAQVSYDRYQGALQAGDAQSAVLQMKAFLFYLTLYNTSAQQASSDINSFLPLLASIGIANDTFDPNLFSELQDYLETNGLPADVVSYLESLGFSNSEINQMLTDFENFDGSTLSGNLYGDLSQASLDLLANTTMSASVPELSTVIMLCSGFVALIVFGAKHRSARMLRRDTRAPPSETRATPPVPSVAT